MLLQGENEKISIKELFERFGRRCFKTKKPLDIKDRSSWAIDHVLPSRYLYPLTISNAALLSKEANDNKRDRWPSEFYSNSELIELAIEGKHRFEKVIIEGKGHQEGGILKLL